ncbi:MAG: TonB-dependent receptor plug domain-containing protein, partial [Ignavibacteriales bacterium]
MKNFLILLFLFAAAFNTTAQTKDTLKTVRPLRDSLSIADTLHARDTSLVKRDSLGVKAEIIVPLHYHGLAQPFGYSAFIRQEQILFHDYRYTGNLIDLFPLAFVRDLGSLGQPNEILIYGSGLNETSYLRDGILINNRLTNSFDVNNIQSESIDSIEVVPLPRSFLYGTVNNPAAINIISKDDFSIGGSKAPYSRLRYSQAPNEEAMIDFIYNAYISRRLITTFELTNKTFSSRFQNSAFSTWNGSLKLKYLLSNSFNISGSYGYVKSETGLNGGVPGTYIDSIGLSNLPLELNVPVSYTSRYQKQTMHNFSLQLLGNYLQHFRSDVNAYYRYYLTEFRMNEKMSDPAVPVIFDDNRSRTYGVSVRQSFSDTLLNADVSAIYEKNELRTDILPANKNLNAFSISGQASSGILGSTLVPSVFAKYLNYDSRSFTGYGADLTLNLTTKYKLYGGISQFYQPLTPLESNFNSGADSKKITTMQAGACVKEKYFTAGLDLFYRQTQNELLPVISPDNKISSYNVRNTDIPGVGLDLGVNVWRIYLESRTAYYFNKKDYSLPSFTFNGGIYYRDTLFNGNLHLKTGFNLRAVGQQNFYAYDFEKNMTAY